MEYSKMFIPTLKDNLQETEALNYKLLNRAGYIRKSAAGVYTLLPLGAKAMDRLQRLVTKPLEDRYYFKQHTPSVQSIEDMIKLMSGGRLSYRELPIGAWFVKEQVLENIRPRLGLLQPRIRRNLQGFKLLHDTKQLTVETDQLMKLWRYLAKALRLDCLEAETMSQHYLGDKDYVLFWPYGSGEDRVVRCTKCGKTLTPDSVKCAERNSASGVDGELKIIHTPRVRTIPEVADFLGMEQRDIVKTLIYKADDRLIGVLVRGDRELSEIKLRTLLNYQILTPATAEEVHQATGAETGFAGPIGLKVEIICDYEVMSMKSMVVGANKTDHHYINVSASRDFKADRAADIRCGADGDACPECGAAAEEVYGFCLAALKKRGAEYSAGQGFVYSSAEGAAKPIYILDFEFNLYRLLAAAVESGSDEAGICVPEDIAPFDIIVMPVHADNEVQQKTAQDIYLMLKDKGFDVILDDREERISVKFKDSELIGIPLRITVGRKAADGIIEVKPRRGQMMELSIDRLMDYIEDGEGYYAGEA